MKKNRKFCRDKKGISSLFIAIYLAVIVVLLISSLFVGLVISKSGLTEYLKVEQEKMQESILLAGPRALNLTGGSIVTALRVNNTGSITVRIRGFYIDHKFVCDPSTFQADAYIEPKESIWIQLIGNLNSSILLNSTTLDAQWTLTTERGTKSSETGINLWIGGPDTPYTPNKFYFGPLMILFDMFHWRSGTGPWRNGWSIPVGTKDVTWRILLTNVDDRDINITNNSCFTLVSNDNAPKDPLPWYVDPTLTTMTFTPGKYYFVHYSWSKAFDNQSDTRQGVTGMGDGTTCINFLVFSGSFIENNGTASPFGQTVPFEAVHVTKEPMANSIEVSATPENIKNDGSSSSTIIASVTDTAGNPIEGVWADFFTTTGSLSENRVQTNAEGIAAVSLTSSLSQATANVVALAEGIVGDCKVNFTPASRINVTADPDNIQSDAGTSDITIQLVRDDNSSVNQAGIAITVSLDWSGGKSPTLTSGGQSGSAITVTTDSNGRALLTLTAQGSAGTATVNGSASGLSPGSTSVTIER